MVDSPMAESIEYRPPTQSQKPNMLAVSMPNSATLSALVETATKCLATADSSPSWPTTQSRAEVALVRVSRVPKVFDEMMKRVSSAARSRGRLHEVGGVDVGDEAEGHVAPAVVAQGLVGHDRPQIGAADAHVDHVADGLARVALPLARPHPLGRRRSWRRGRR